MVNFIQYTFYQASVTSIAKFQFLKTETTWYVQSLYTLGLLYHEGNNIY